MREETRTSIPSKLHCGLPIDLYALLFPLETPA